MGGVVGTEKRSTPPTQLPGVATVSPRSPPEILPIAKSPSEHTLSNDTRVSVSPSDMASGFTEELVPTVFKWKQGGEEVYVTGTFNCWKEKIPLQRSTKDFTTIQYLPTGVHQYKFIVDGKWRHAPDQPMAADLDGVLNNCMEVRKVTTNQDENPFASSSPPGDYSQQDWTDKPGSFAKDPPSLPPHLLRALLNTAPVSKDDPVLLPLPHHVMINHVYYLSRPEENDVEVLGVTHRYRTKFVTTVIYQPAAKTFFGNSQENGNEINVNTQPN